MKNGASNVEEVWGMEFLHGDAEVTAGTGSFYTDAFAARLHAGALRCDCAACREQQWQQLLFQREST